MIEFTLSSVIHLKIQQKIYSKKATKIHFSNANFLQFADFTAKGYRVFGFEIRKKQAFDFHKSCRSWNCNRCVAVVSVSLGMQDACKSFSKTRVLCKESAEEEKMHSSGWIQQQQRFDGLIEWMNESLLEDVEEISS